MISEKTRVTLSIATIIGLVGTIALSTWSVSELKGNFDHRISQIEYRESCLEVDVQGMKIIQSANQADFAEIKTDLKWIRAALSED